MKRSVSVAIMAAMILVFFGGLTVAGGGIEVFLDNLNVEARADMHGYAVKLSTQFGVPVPQVQAVIHKVDAPADAFMCFQLGHMSGHPYERVVQTYRTNRGKGWGVIAKSLGIKPGSPEFHALKNGDFVFNGQPQEEPRQGKGKGGGHGRGQGKNK
jgi:hypothetical protein